MKTKLQNKQIAGVTLIEVLVAIVITSIGILGFASLQFLGLNSNQSAYHRSQASFIATDLSERMRGNMDGISADNYANLDTNALDCDTLPATFCDARNYSGTQIPAANCNPAELAAHDFFAVFCGYSGNGYANHAAEKTTNLADILPGARITVTCNDVPCGDFSDHTIVVTWLESNEAADGNGNLQMSAMAGKTISYRFMP